MVELSAEWALVLATAGLVGATAEYWHTSRGGWPVSQEHSQE